MRQDRQNAEYKEANRKYQNEWYHNNKEAALKTRQQRKDRLRQEYHDYKSGRGCQTCGETHPYCLELHHPDPTVKDLNPSDKIKRGLSFKKLKEEFDQLQVLCANCHRKVHYPLGS